MRATQSSNATFTLTDAALVLAPRVRMLVLLPLFVGLVTLGIAFMLQPVFTARTQLLPPQQQSSTAAALLGSLGGIAGGLGAAAGALKNPTEQWIGLLRSRVVADAIVDRFKLRELYKSDYQFQARDTLAANTKILAGKDGLILVEVDDISPQRASQIAQAYVDELRRLATTLAVTEAAQRRLFFQKQLGDAKDNLIKAELALREGGVGTELVKTMPSAAVSGLARAQAAIAAQEVKISVMRGTLTENNPEYMQAARELASLREQMRLLEQDGPAQSRNGAATYVARYREFKYYETLFELFARQYEAARADEARDGSLIQVVDPPQVPEYKSKPRRAMLAVLATVFTFMACVTYLLTRSALGRHFATPHGQAKLMALKRALHGGDAAES